MTIKVAAILIGAGLFTHHGLIWLGLVLLLIRSIVGQPYRKYH